MPDPVVLTVGGARVEISEQLTEEIALVMVRRLDDSYGTDWQARAAGARSVARLLLHAPGLLARLVEIAEITTPENVSTFVETAGIIAVEARALLAGEAR